jgi:hypothetical protein
MTNMVGSNLHIVMKSLQKEKDKAHINNISEGKWVEHYRELWYVPEEDREDRDDIEEVSPDNSVDAIATFT